MPRKLRATQVPGYPWYDRDTGAIDLVALAHRVTGVPHAEVPRWLAELELPVAIADAWATELAAIEARAGRAWAEISRAPPR